MDVEEEGQVVVGERMLVVKQDTHFQMFNGMLVVADLKVSHCKIVLQLCVFSIDPLRLLIR